VSLLSVSVRVTILAVAVIDRRSGVAG
jgi:hypothetical protein